MINQDPEKNNLLSKLDSLESRISNIEERLGIYSPIIKSQISSENEPPPEKSKIIEDEQESALESRIGGYGMALIGNVVLLFGIIFLWQYIQKLGYPIFSFFFGYISVALILLAAKYLRKKIASMAFMFDIVGQSMLYFVTLRLHFFSENPIISSITLGIILLLVVIGYQVYIALKNKSELFGGIALVMTIITGIASDTTYFMLSTATITSLGAVYFFFRYSWKTTLITSIFLSFSIFIIWILKNPDLLNAANLQLHHICNLFLMTCAMAFSLITLAPKKETFTKTFIVGTVLTYGSIFSFVLIFFVFTFFTNNYIILFSAISIFCIIFSIILKNYSEWKFSPAFYAVYGFVAISVSVYGIYGLPYVYMLLALQSLLVLSMSLWFRSLIIVGLNTAMFFTLLLTYLVTSESVDLINFTFALVAFVTARVLNLNKPRLNLETNYLRNAYLVIMFFMVLYSLDKALPDTYITLSWTISALVFFIFNSILNNPKYRLMAICAIIAASIRLFLMDLSQVSFVLRIVAFLFLAIISIGISIYYYTKIKSKTSLEAKDDQENFNES